MDVVAKRDIVEVEIPAMILTARETEQLGRWLEEFLGEEKLGNEPLQKDWESRYPNLRALYDALIREEVI